MKEPVSTKLQSLGELQQTKVIALFSLVGMTITGLMALFAVYNQSWTLALSLFGSSSIFFFAFYLVKWRNHSHVSSIIITYSLYILMFYLILTGGVANTGPLWISIVPPVTVYIHGLRKGLINISIFVSIAAFIMFSPNIIEQQALYPIEFKLRIIYSFLTISFLSALYEYSRTGLYNSALALNNKLNYLAHFDELTGLRNRRSAEIILDDHVLKAKSGATFSVLLCDIDFFKQVNDKYGHNIGDKVLVETANVFTKLLRDTDYVSRWGGEEFLFILPDTNINEAYDIAERIRTAVAQHQVSLMDHDISVTISIGIQEHRGIMSLDNLISLADKYLYEAKRAGRNRCLPHV
ncbi:GGDEF domain-containing protein [Shewanella aestuarii]|uniref:GGDEF domain-containing protein n=1 Tax=Shewanella aestuarii TaxID=1028752 RepID=UPI001FCB441B|nr:GGDEF domain-containing protein [Shewanella aestuarii]